MAGLASQLEPGQGPQAGLRGVLGVWATGRMSNPTEKVGGRLRVKARPEGPGLLCLSRAKGGGLLAPSWLEARLLAGGCWY